jgi:Tryptophan halogenase
MDSLSENHTSYEQKIALEKSIREILGDQYGDSASLRGWLFSVLVDGQFIDGGLNKNPIRKRLGHWTSCAESADITQAATDHLERINQLGDVIDQYAALDDLTRLSTPSLTQDSFAGLTEMQSWQAVSEFFSGGEFNVVIIGAGPVGLLLASALKMAFKSRINVLLIESRVAALHQKLPYERRWITNVPCIVLHGLVENILLEIFNQVGANENIGCNINVLESLLLLSCRRLGVKFLFVENSDFSSIKSSVVQMVFDASGNRYQSPDWPNSPSQISFNTKVETALLGCNTANYSAYGIKIRPSRQNRDISLYSYNNLTFPLYKNKPVKLAMLKLINIPVALYGALLSHIAQDNIDNKFYIWKGTLQAAVNQVIVIISLRKAEYDYLCKHYDFPISIAEVINVEEFVKSMDERTMAILQMLADHEILHEPITHGSITIDAPFLFEPYLVNRAAVDQLQGWPLVRVGDSIYNGNVKLGNGLTPHMQHVKHIQSTLQKFIF